MTKADTQTIAHLAAILAERALPARAAALAMQLYEIGSKLSRLAVKECNDPSWSDRDTERRYKLAAMAQEALRSAGFPVRVAANGDPRGHGLHIFFDPPRGNTWGGDEAGFGIG